MRTAPRSSTSRWPLSSCAMSSPSAVAATITKLQGRSERRVTSVAPLWLVSTMKVWPYYKRSQAMSARSNATAARQSLLRKAALVERAAPRRNPQEKDMDVNEEQQEARGGVVTSYKDAPPRTVSAGGVDFAYRELGPKAGVPVIFLVHLAGVLDNWDPRVVDGIAAKHRVIAFDNRGVGASTGKTPDTIQAMAKDAVTFI